MLQAVVGKIDSDNAGPSTARAPALPGQVIDLTGMLFRDYFCGVALLGTHVSAEIKEKIATYQFIDIRSFFLPEQLMVDKEICFEKGEDKKAKKSAKSSGNWLQDFLTMASVISQHRPEKTHEFFV